MSHGGCPTRQRVIAGGSLPIRVRVGGAMLLTTWRTEVSVHGSLALTTPWQSDASAVVWNDIMVEVA